MSFASPLRGETNVGRLEDAKGRCYGSVERIGPLARPSAFGDIRDAFEGVVGITLLRRELLNLKSNFIFVVNCY